MAIIYSSLWEQTN